MKKYHVIVTPEAQSGIRESFLYIRARSPINAVRWLQGLYAEIDSLERFPERCSYAREREYLDEEFRQLVFKSHRVVFFVDKPRNTVYVVYVRHGRQRAVGAPELENTE